MKRLGTFLMTFLACSPAIADQEMPQVPERMIFIHARDPMTDKAMRYVQGATLLQMGWKDDLEHIEKRVAKHAEASASVVIHEYTPFNPKHVFFTFGLGYGVLVEQKLTSKFRNPILQYVTHTITIGREVYMLDMKVSF